MGKLMMIAAFVAGYVLGARAGRERYEQIMSFVDQLQGRTTDARQAAPERFDSFQREGDDVVYSTGPDVEATVRELIPDNDADRM